MNKGFLKGTAGALVLLAAGGAFAEEETTAWRLFVSDHSAAVVTGVDVASGEIIDRFQTYGPARLVRSEDGTRVLAVQTNDDVVQVIDTGIEFEDHGGHADIHLDAPGLADFTVAGQYPVHTVEHSGKWAVFFDKEGLARVFDNHLEGAETPSFVNVVADAPHHGVAVAFGERSLVSVPNPENADALPIGIEVLDRSGDRIGDVAECPDLHGEATSGDLLVFACGDGILVVRAGRSGPEFQHIEYGAAGADERVTTVLGGRGLQYFLGNFGARKVVLFDPFEAAPYRVVDLPTRRVDFAVDPIRAQFAYVFTEDGTLRQLNVLSGRLVDDLKLTGPYSMDGNWSDPRPRIAVAGDLIAVTDPLEGKVHLVDAATFEKASEIGLEGMPYTIVAVGGTGMSEDHDHEHEHEDD